MTTTTYQVQTRLHGLGWRTVAQLESQEVAVTFSDRLIEGATPGFYDGKLRVIERVITERTVLSVRGTVWVWV